MAVATGVVVANMYYAQPLLHQIAHAFSAGTTSTSLVVTCTQLGYAASLLLVVPLGDLRPRRDLVVTAYAVAVVALVVCAVSPDLWVFELASVATGCASVAGQILVPFAADLAAPERRGRVVARLMTGLLVGILLARTLSGLVAQYAGWRAIYWLSAGLMVIFAVLLRLGLPGEPRRPALPYRSLVASSVQLLRAQPAVRRRAFYGATTFGAFSVLWTSLAFLLSGPPFGYSNLDIGLFGLAGVAGVAAANLAGHLADRGRRAATTAAAALVTAGAFGLLWAGRASLWPLVAGIVVLDVGVEAMHITNQSVIYELAPGARSRVNSAYMFCYFLGGAIGSIGAGAVYAAGRWDGVCALGGGIGLLALAMAGFDRWRPPGGRRGTATTARPALTT